MLNFPLANISRKTTTGKVMGFKNNNHKQIMSYNNGKVEKRVPDTYPPWLKTKSGKLPQTKEDFKYRKS
jgi:hypothetical protein